MASVASKREKKLIYDDQVEYYIERRFPDFIDASSDPIRAMAELEEFIFRYGDDHKWKMINMLRTIYNSPRRSIRNSSSFLESLRDQVIEWFSKEPGERRREYPLTGKQIKGAYKWYKSSLGFG